MPNKRKLKKLPIAIVNASMLGYALTMERALSMRKVLPSILIPMERGDSRGNLLATEIGLQHGVGIARKIRPDRMYRHQAKRYKGGDNLANHVALRLARKNKASFRNFI